MYPIITETTITLEEFIKLNETILRQNKAIKRTFIINIIITLFFIISINLLFLHRRNYNFFYARLNYYIFLI